MKALVGLLDAVNALGPICESGMLKVEATNDKVFVQAINAPIDEGELYAARATDYWDDFPAVQGYGELNAPFDDLRGNFIVGRFSVLTGFAAQHRLSKVEVVSGASPYEDTHFIRFDRGDGFKSQYMIGKDREAIPYSTLSFSTFTPVVSFQIDQRAADLLKRKAAATEPVEGEKRFWLHMNKRGQVFASFDQKPRCNATDRTMLACGIPNFALRPHSYPSEPVVSALALTKKGIQVTMKVSSRGQMALELQTNFGHYTVEIWGSTELISRWTPSDPELLLTEALTRFHDEKSMYADWEPPL